MERNICSLKTIKDEEYAKWLYMVGEYYRGQRD
jgi:hypothetical protein